ncbi:hypothetical protein [Aquimonas sp.]|jgi:hypothetical protein|uniref:hypothetical protein n=1 Tax=Aquimonas sp. TaxID=1872588 RepID=UPI0037C10B3B
MTIERFRHSAPVDARLVKASRFKLQPAGSTGAVRGAFDVRRGHMETLACGGERSE